MTDQSRIGGPIKELLSLPTGHNTVRHPNSVRRHRTACETMLRHDSSPQKRPPPSRHSPAPTDIEGPATFDDHHGESVPLIPSFRPQRRAQGNQGNPKACSAQYRNTGFRQGGSSNVKRQSLHQTWRSATESRVPDQQADAGKAPLDEQSAWTMRYSAGTESHRSPPVENSIICDCSPQKTCSLSNQRDFQSQHGSTSGLHRCSSQANSKRKAAASGKKGVSRVQAPTLDKNGGTVDSDRLQDRLRGNDGRHSSRGRCGGATGIIQDTITRPIELHTAPTIRKSRVPNLRTSQTEDKSFFRTVSFGHTDRDFFATSQVGCFYDGINRELERILLELSEECRRARSTHKLLRLPDENEESWASRNIPPPKTVVLGPAHQFYCYLRGQDLAQGVAEDKAYYRCNSGSTSLLDQIERDPLAIEFLTFGFKPDSYFCLTAHQMFHNRLPLDMVHTIELEEIDVESVQLWKGDGWFIKDSKSGIYFNNIQDLTLQIIFEKHHPLDPVEHFSISLNGLNWYIRTASGAEFYKSQVLQNIQKKHDAQFPEAASFFRPQSGAKLTEQ